MLHSRRIHVLIVLYSIPSTFHAEHCLVLIAASGYFDNATEVKIGKGMQWQELVCCRPASNVYPTIPALYRYPMPNVLYFFLH
jgi:hypothetical protein